MAVVMRSPEPGGLDAVIDELASWQDDHAPLQLHPGDIGWALRQGREAVACSLRTWADQCGETVAIGMLEGPELLRLAIRPDLQSHHATAQGLAQVVARRGRGALLSDAAAIELPTGAVLDDLLAEDGWIADEPWVPLQRDLRQPPPAPDLRIEVVGPESAAARVRVHRDSFGSASTFTDQAWRILHSDPVYRRARCLLGIAEDGTAVAATTVWSAGTGRPGLIEPLGVSAEHRGHGFGAAIARAAMAVLRDLGSSGAQVCTPSSNRAGVAAYLSAGFSARPERRDRRRD